MAIQRKYDVPLSTLSTFRIGGKAREVVLVENEADLKALFSELPVGTRWMMLGGGSNLVFPDGDSDMLFIKLLPKGTRIVSDDGTTVEIKTGGGDTWDAVVAFAVAHELSGIEALSAIPGTAGATPVQNVGAYGIEIKDVLISLRAFDTQKKEITLFTNAECEFAYRDSMFKHAGKGRYIITELTLRLLRAKPTVPNYPGVAEYFAEKRISDPSLSDIREAITTIRWKKLPDPRDIASVGSFFKNPFVPVAQAEKLQKKYPTMKMFPAGDGTAKVPAGWLIENAGFKGKRFENLSVYHGNALVLVNEGGATRQELSVLVEKIVSEVNSKFGITLEPEPEMLDF